MAAALILAGSFLVTVPAAADDSEGIGPGSEVLRDTSREQSTTDDGTDSGGGGEESPPIDDGNGTGGEEQPTYNDAIEYLQPEGPIGPVGFTGVPTYEAVWAPGETVPTAVKILSDDSNVELVTFETEDRSAFAALLVIDSPEASTEYRFENAVPDGRTAELHTDGSVRFFDLDGNESGGIAVPWALDANGAAVPTRYALDGTTLIQTVDHEGAAYPVVADPVWFGAVVLAIRLAAPAATQAVVTCARSQCVRIVTTVVTAVFNAVKPSGGSGGGGGRPGNTPSCNARNRIGC